MAEASPTTARWTLTVVCVAVFMLLLDVTIVAVALGDIQADLGADLAGLQWVIDAYTLTLACLLLTAATIGDRIGRLRVFATGLLIFTAASLGCGLAGSIEWLNALRAVQGVGGAMLFGTALPLIGAAFPTPAARAKAIGAFGATASASSAVGPLVGGALVDGPGWEWIFFVNVPIGLLSLLAVTRMHDSRAEHPRRADWPGTALLTAALAAVLIGLIRGGDQGWSSPLIVGLFVAAVLLLAGFVARELTADQPMLDLSLFRRAAFTGVGLSAFALSATLLASTTYLVLYLQNGLGYSPFESGLRALPLTLSSFVVAPLAAAFYHRLGGRLLLSLSMLLAGGGMLWASTVDGADRWTVLLPGLVLAGLGLGMGMAASSSAALDAVEPARAGMATGAVNTLRQVGTATGVAALGAVFTHVGTARASELLTPFTQLPAASARAIADGVGAGAGQRVVAALPSALPEQARALISSAVLDASADALSTVLLWGGALGLVSAVLIAVLMRPTPAASEPTPATEPADLSA